MVRMSSIPNALPALEPSVCSSAECPLVCGCKAFCRQTFGRNLEEVALGVLEVDLGRDLITHTALVTGLSAVDLVSGVPALSQQV